MPVHSDDAILQEQLLQRFPLRPTRTRPEISLYLASPGAGFRFGPKPPYWAFVWAGGAALATHIHRFPEVARGRTVLDLCAGSGIVGIAAALAGAVHVTACDTDTNAIVAIAANAEANGVDIVVVADRPATVGPYDVVLAGDAFYSRSVAKAVMPILRAARAAGKQVLIGDPGRKTFPVGEFEQIAAYDVEDFGSAAPVAAGVYRLK